MGQLVEAYKRNPNIQPNKQQIKELQENLMTLLKQKEVIVGTHIDRDNKIGVKYMEELKKITPQINRIQLLQLNHNQKSIPVIMGTNININNLAPKQNMNNNHIRSENNQQTIRPIFTLNDTQQQSVAAISTANNHQTQSNGDISTFNNQSEPVLSSKKSDLNTEKNHEIKKEPNDLIIIKKEENNINSDAETITSSHGEHPQNSIYAPSSQHAANNNQYAIIDIDDDSDEDSNSVEILDEPPPQKPKHSIQNNGKKRGIDDVNNVTDNTVMFFFIFLFFYVGIVILLKLC